MINQAQALATLRRLFGGGKITRLPKRPEDADLFLALAASSLDPRFQYTEPSLNEALQAWMAGFTGGTHMDHVTLRRCLVDRSLLLRDDAGDHYRVNGTVIASIADADACQIHPLEIFEEVQRERSLRKRRQQAD